MSSPTDRATLHIVHIKANRSTPCTHWPERVKGDYVWTLCGKVKPNHETWVATKRQKVACVDCQRELLAGR